MKFCLFTVAAANDVLLSDVKVCDDVKNYQLYAIMTMLLHSSISCFSHSIALILEKHQHGAFQPLGLCGSLDYAIFFLCAFFFFFFTFTIFSAFSPLVALFNRKLTKETKL